MSRVRRAEQRAAKIWSVLVAATLLALLLGAQRAGSAAADTVPPPVAANVRASLDKPYLIIAKPLHRAHVTGRVTGVAQPAGLAVVLEASSRTFHRKRSWRASTDAGGRFAFSIQPVFDSVLRVKLERGQAATGHSDAIAQYVFPRLHFKVTPARQEPLRVGFSLVEDGPARMTFDDGFAIRARPGSARLAYFYAAPPQKDTYKLVASIRLKAGRCATFCTIGGAGSVPLTKVLVAPKLKFVACTRGTVFRGLGAPDDACGKATLHRR